MASPKQTKGSKQMILSLLGINRNKGHAKRTNKLALIDYLCFIFVCAGAGYLATMQGFDSLPLNADSLAPFEEAKSLINNPDTHLFNIHVSRIPSIFPDLTLNSLLQLINPQAGFLEIFSLYSWCTSFAFLLLATVLIQEINTKPQPFTATAIKTSLVTIGLLNISHQFNIAYAHILTPVHHGGNALNTLLLLTLSLRLVRNQKQTGIRVVFLSVIFLAAMSNKLSIFTAILPAAIIFVIHLKGPLRNQYLIQLVMTTAAGLLAGSLLNEQCATAKIDLSQTLIAFKQYFQLSWITLASTLISVSSLYYVIKKKSDLPKQTSAGLTAISLSSLSYFFYLPVLTGRGEAPLRYICIAYVLFVVFLVAYINRINSRKQAAALITLAITTILSFQSPVSPLLNLATHSSLKQTLLNRGESIDPYKHDVADFILKMGYSSYLGLSEYWMTGTTLVSNSKVEIVPILQNGKPDFWGATPQDIRQQIQSLDKSNAYVVSDNDAFLEKLEEPYGTPKITWNYNSETRQFTQNNIDTSNRLLIYNNSKIYNKISKKAKHFRRQCNKSLPNYRKR
jgi:uncharacterized membrane protein YecN with MAPEG domain